MAHRDNAGFSLFETIIALGILAVVAAGVMPLGIIATKTTENQGHLMARTTEYAADKLEQLMALSYGDAITDTRVFPAAPAGGTGLALGGSVNPVMPAAGYVDYLDINGNVVTDDTWYYRRVWMIVQHSANLKRITVTTIVRYSAAGGAGRLPQSTVTALKTFPF
jgi:prepilin-type N-terminal cleavage/methylation domain-containing protein